MDTCGKLAIVTQTPSLDLQVAIKVNEDIGKHRSKQI